MKREATQREIPDLHEELARKARIAELETEIAERASSQGTSFRSISAPVDSVPKISGRMDKSDTAENEAKSNLAVSVLSTAENAMELVDYEGKFSAPKKDSKPPEKPTISTEAK